MPRQHRKQRHGEQEKVVSASDLPVGEDVTLFFSLDCRISESSLLVTDF